MLNNIKINMLRSKSLDNIILKCISIKKMPKLNPYENQQFMKYLYKHLKNPIYGYFYNNKIYFFGSNESLLNLGKNLKYKFDIELEHTDIQNINLDLNNEIHKNIILKNLYDVLREYLRNKNFITPFESSYNIALPSGIIQTKVDYSIFYENKFIESFMFNLNISGENEILLTIEPKIFTLIPYKQKKDTVVIPYCFNTEIMNEIYEVLPNNFCLFSSECNYQKYPWTNINLESATIYDPIKNKYLFLPITNIYNKASYGDVPYYDIRKYSLKPSDRRISYTLRFINLIQDNNNIILYLGNNTITFPSDLISLNNESDNTKLKSLKDYSIIPQSEVLFGDNLSSVNPYNGLKRWGPYSYNKTGDSRYYQPKIRILCLVPSNMESKAGMFLNYLINGKLNYFGFDENKNPFRSKAIFNIHDIPYDTEDTYISRLKVNIQNIYEDYPVKEGLILLLPIPEYSYKIYREIKDYCFARKLKTQFIKESNLNLGWYPLHIFGLSIFTKAGGTPWMIDSSFFDIADCYIGQAFSKLSIIENMSSKFFVGAADIFNNYGEYISFALHQGSVDKEITGLNVDRNFMKELTHKAVLRYYDKNKFYPEKLLIHRSNKFIKEEIEGVIDVLKEIDIKKCYLVHVQHNNLYRSYDETLQYQIRRGTYFKISPNEIILFPTGFLDQENKYHAMGTPKSVQLNIKLLTNDGIIINQISNSDIYKIVKNFLGFTRLRWNSLSTTLREPLTIHASRKMAEWLKEGYSNLEGLDIRDIL